MIEKLERERREREERQRPAQRIELEILPPGQGGARPERSGPGGSVVVIQVW